MQSGVSSRALSWYCDLIPELVTRFDIQIVVCIEGRDMNLLIKIAESHSPPHQQLILWLVAFLEMFNFNVKHYAAVKM